MVDTIRKPDKISSFEWHLKTSPLETNLLSTIQKPDKSGFRIMVLKKLLCVILVQGDPKRTFENQKHSTTKHFEGQCLNGKSISTQSIARLFKIQTIQNLDKIVQFSNVFDKMAAIL